MPTQNLLRLLLLLMLIVRIMLATVCYRFGSWCLILKLNFFQTSSSRVGQDFEVEVQQDFETGACSAFCRWCFVEVMKLNLGRYSEARLGQDFEFESKFLRWNLIKICVWTCNMTLARWTQPSGPLCLWQCLPFAIP